MYTHTHMYTLVSYSTSNTGSSPILLGGLKFSVPYYIHVYNTQLYYKFPPTTYGFPATSKEGNSPLFMVFFYVLFMNSIQVNSHYKHVQQSYYKFPQTHNYTHGSHATSKHIYTWFPCYFQTYIHMVPMLLPNTYTHCSHATSKEGLAALCFREFLGFSFRQQW